MKFDIGARMMGVGVKTKLGGKMKPTIQIIAGVILGSICTSTWAASKYSAVNLDQLGFGDISVAAINDLGSFAGAKIKSDGYPGELAIWSNGKESIIDQSQIDLGSIMGLNNKSQVLSFNNTTQNQGIIYDNGKFTSLPTLGGNFGGPWDINNLGQVAGYASTSRGTGFSEIHAVIWDNGKVIDLGTAGGKFTSFAYALNDKTDVVGYSGNHAVLWSNGKTTILESIAGSHSARASDINNNGQIIGESYMNNNLPMVATYWENGKVFDLGSLGGGFVQAQAINDAGQIVGISETSDSDIGHAFIWEKGHMLDLNSLMDDNFIRSGFIVNGAWDINNHGSILADAFNQSTGEHRDILINPISPIPEPTTWAMLLAGLGLVGFYFKRDTMTGI